MAPQCRRVCWINNRAKLATNVGLELYRLYRALDSTEKPPKRTQTWAKLVNNCSLSVKFCSSFDRQPWGSVTSLYWRHPVWVSVNVTNWQQHSVTFWVGGEGTKISLFKYQKWVFQRAFSQICPRSFQEREEIVIFYVHTRGLFIMLSATLIKAEIILPLPRHDNVREYTLAPIRITAKHATGFFFCSQSGVSKSGNHFPYWIHLFVIQVLQHSRIHLKVSLRKFTKRMFSRVGAETEVYCQSITSGARIRFSQ